MSKIVGVRFRRAGKIYNFSPGDIETVYGSKVIVETSRGVEIGTVAVPEHEAKESDHIQALKEVIRKATDEDMAHHADNKKKEMEAFVICLDKIKKHGLQMKLIDCEITFDNSKMLFYFTADGRIDFRDLVKDLASVFHTRIELRQEGVRDETKTLGGLGCCGRELCCHSYLTDFAPVSIKMAKNQNLSLNTSKISGVCGRLLCCLNYEEQVYEELNSKLPSNGDYAVTSDGFRGTVSSVNTLRQLVKVLIELPDGEKEIREYPAAQIRFRSRKKGVPRNEHIDFDELDFSDVKEPEEMQDECQAEEEYMPDNDIDHGSGDNNREEKKRIRNTRERDRKNDGRKRQRNRNPRENRQRKTDDHIT